MRPIVVAALGGLIASALVTGAARAEEADNDSPGFTEAPAVRRSGFAFGAFSGLSLNAARGYPNEVEKIGLPQYEVKGGLAPSNGGGLWVGGAITDWFTIGIGILGSGFKAKGLTAAGGAFEFRIETFPLFYRGGVWRDAGLAFTAGTGGYTLQRAKVTVAEGQGTSCVGAGAFLQPIHFWRISMGPQLEYGYQFARSLTAHTFIIGWRTAFYGGP